MSEEQIVQIQVRLLPVPREVTGDVLSLDSRSAHAVQGELGGGHTQWEAPRVE